MEAFEWSPIFETGLNEVDVQHRRLIDLVNQLGANANSGSPEEIDATIAALADYTVYHFQTEESIMAGDGVAAAHADRHRETHRRFVAQVIEWIERRKRGESVNLGQLLEFLANWLIFHILGDDQSLGRQVNAIRAGTPAARAYAEDRTSDDPRTDILLGALRRLYAGLVERNASLVEAQKSLTQLNATLEQRVAERTAALSEANIRLQEERERVLAAEKMASLGRMVAGFAHELNTPVGVAVGAASQLREVATGLQALLTQDEVDEEDFRRRLATIDEAAALTLSNLQRAAGMVQSFKRTAVDHASEAERDYELAELIEDVHRSLHNAFKSTAIEIDVDCADGIQLFGPAGALIQVLSNLLQNSRMHAFADGTRPGRIRISAKRAGDRVVIDYADDGAGMSPETLEHAFEPFFTTRRGSGGSGLGLYIAYNLVTQALGGSIRCESRPEQGTHFHIDMPVRQRATEVNTA